jgi:hypothetical protein
MLLFLSIMYTPRSKKRKLWPITMAYAAHAEKSGAAEILHRDR